MFKLIVVALSLMASNAWADAEFLRHQEEMSALQNAQFQRQYDKINAYYDQREAENRRYYEEADQRRAVNEILARERMEARDRGDYVPNNTYMKDLACTGYSNDCD